MDVYHIPLSVSGSGADSIDSVVKNLDVGATLQSRGNS